MVSFHSDILGWISGKTCVMGHHGQHICCLQTHALQYLKSLSYRNASFADCVVAPCTVWFTDSFITMLNVVP